MPAPSMIDCRGTLFFKCEKLRPKVTGLAQKKKERIVTMHSLASAYPSNHPKVSLSTGR